MIDYPAEVQAFNTRLRVELGHNPLYAWRWSGDLLHVMELIHDDGTPKYLQEVSPEGLILVVPETETRLLLPNHPANWVVCALVEVNGRDGSVQGTGSASWIPISSSNSGPVALPIGWVPTKEMTDRVIEAIRRDRGRRAKDMVGSWEEERRAKEKQHWNTIYEQIREANTAFLSVPGTKGSVSFPSPERTIQ